MPPWDHANAALGLESNPVEDPGLLRLRRAGRLHLRELLRLRRAGRCACASSVQVNAA
jgi:hypothetical protein